MHVYLINYVSIRPTHEYKAAVMAVCSTRETAMKMLRELVENHNLFASGKSQLLVLSEEGAYASNDYDEMYISVMEMDK